MKKLLIQCDFDGTVLEEDISFSILEEYAQGDWKAIDREYLAGKINVAEFNERAFGLVKVGLEEQMRFIRGKEKPRPGFRELIQLCEERQIKFVVVSNGFEYYIEHIFNHLGLSNIEYHAAKVIFNNSRMHIDYISHDGKLLRSGFKDSYTDKFLKEGYEIIYIGNGMSDFSPAKKCRTVFACDSLVKYCDEAKIPYVLFHDFHDVITHIKTLV
jgi:2-hydroxy-3-keto-5-methylthiopentenyl-1-phosphate phosphatase